MISCHCIDPFPSVYITYHVGQWHLYASVICCIVLAVFILFKMNPCIHHALCKKIRGKPQFIQHIAPRSIVTAIVGTLNGVTKFIPTNMPYDYYNCLQDMPNRHWRRQLESESFLQSGIASVVILDNVFDRNRRVSMPLRVKMVANRQYNIL